MGYQVYKLKKRWGGYGVPTICEHPDCNEEIDRGMSYACGGEPFSELGCDRYFCSKHLDYVAFNGDINKKCRHKKDCDCRHIQICDRCLTNKQPYPYKPETSEWIEHLLTDESWEEWRNDNPDIVELYKNNPKTIL